jgi:hypothetical protein
MASHYYAECASGKSRASRTGTLKTGIRAVVASWQGACHTTLYDKDGVTYVRVHLALWGGKGTSKLIYDGPVGEYAP